MGWKELEDQPNRRKRETSPGPGEKKGGRYKEEKMEDKGVSTFFRMN